MLTQGPAPRGLGSKAVRSADTEALKGMWYKANTRQWAGTVMAGPPSSVDRNSIGRNSADERNILIYTMNTDDT